jgi:hypothetical protein
MSRSVASTTHAVLLDNKGPYAIPGPPAVAGGPSRYFGAIGQAGRVPPA